MAGWWQERRAEGIVRTLARAADPATKLQRLGSAVDDAVISALLNESDRAHQAGHMSDAMRWAELALRATLLGGGAEARAEALIWHAGTLFDRLKLAKDDQERAALIARAETDAHAAAAVYAETGSADNQLMAHLLLVRVDEARGETQSMMRRLLDCVRMVHDTTDRDLAIDVLDLFASRYHALRGSEADAWAPDLTTELGTVVARTEDRQARGKLLNLLGDAHSRQSNDTDVLAVWSTAADLYHELGELHDEFGVRTELLDYFAPRDDLDLALELGLACLASAPPDPSLASLAMVHHLVAFVHYRRGEVDEARRAYAREVEVCSSDQKTPVGPILFESAMMMIEYGRFAEARSLLEDVLARSGFERLFWAAEFELAGVLGLNLGDVGAGIEHVESALASAVSMETKRPIMRMVSLHLSAALHFLAGDLDTAYRRSRLLVQMLAEPPEVYTIHISRTYEYAVFPRQSRADMLRLAADISRAIGQTDETEALLAMSQGIVDEPPPQVPMDDDDPLDDEMTGIQEAYQDAAKAVALLNVDPRAALAQFERLSAFYADSPAIGHFRLLVGKAQLDLGDRPTARTTFEQCLADVGPHQSQLEQQCHRYLAEICITDGQYEGARVHLKARVKALESMRASLRDVEGRIRFLRRRLGIYQQLIEVCLLLGRSEEAFVFVQRIKSRSLLDLMADDEHRPIDHALDGRATRTRDDREEWITKYIEGTLLEGESDDVTTWPRIRMHKYYLSLKDAMAAITKEREELGLFDRLRGEGVPVDYDAVRAMLKVT
jgi:tetratricopeptide (TPR) repeat protein